MSQRHKKVPIKFTVSTGDIEVEETVDLAVVYEGDDDPEITEADVENFVYMMSKRLRTHLVEILREMQS